MAGGATYSKRLKERKRQDQQREKLERKRQRAQEKQSTGGGPEIDWNHSQGEVFDDSSESVEVEDSEQRSDDAV